MKVVQPIRENSKIEQIKKVLLDKNERDYLMFCIGIYTGLRISDIRKLMVGDLKNKEYLRVTEEKTGKENKILINPQLKRILKKYLEFRRDDEYILKSREGHNKPITNDMAYKILNAAAKQVGLEEIGTHTMRKTFGYHFYLKTKNIGLLMDIFNHSSERITLRYIGINQDKRDKGLRAFRY